MGMRNLGRGEWKPFFEGLSRELVVTPVNVQIRVEAPDLGSVVQDRELPCRGFTYSERDDAFEVHADRHLHRVDRPGEIRLEEAGDGVQRIEVIDGDGRRHTMRLSRPATGAGTAL